MTKPDSAAHDVIAQMIDMIILNAPDHDDLDTLAQQAGYDPTHFHKLFKKSVGVTPKQFQSYLNLRHARDLLTSGCTTDDAAAQINLSGTGRLYDLFTLHEAVRPGDVQKRGLGLTIYYGWHPTALGDLLIAVTERGICWLGFRLGHDTDDTFKRLRAYWPQANLVHAPDQTKRYARIIEDIWCKDVPLKTPLPLDIHGTNFQLQVWRALLRIPTGALVSYHDVAQAIGKPTASRAVGSAVGDNPISLIIPCHRVIQSSGIIENYGWGSDRKRALIGLEHKKQ